MSSIHFSPVEKKLGEFFSARGGYVPAGDVHEFLYGELPEKNRPKIESISPHIFHLRKKLKPFNVQITTRWGRGWYISENNAACLRALIDGKV